MDSSRTSTILTIAGVTIVSGVVAYAVYFDYKRRNDTEFRKRLRKEKKRVDKSIAQSKESLAASSSSSEEITDAALRDALEQIKKETPPRSPEEKESYFMSQVSMGEQLAIKGPNFYLPSAMAFYRALRVYPSPVELIVIYQKTVPQPIFKIVMDMTNLDVKTRIEGYYEFFPPKTTNVTIETRDGRKVVILTNDVKAGEIIFKEHPVVTALDCDLQGSRTHCAHCFRHIEPNTSIDPAAEINPLSLSFCSQDCLNANKLQSHSLLFTRESPLPGGVANSPPSSNDMKAREEAQEKFAAYIKKEGRATPLLTARFIARQVWVETTKVLSGGTAPVVENDYTGADSDQYFLADHIERLRYLEVKPPAEELPLLENVLRTALSGLEQFVTSERHGILNGKMAYNAIGVCFDEGRTDKPPSDARPEDIERSRTPYGTSKQIGSAIYTLSSYLNHSCNPSARPSFATGTTQLHLIANRDLKQGDELTMAYVDVTLHPDESVVDCRRRRRQELARGWRFACSCSRCAEEAETITSEEAKTTTAEMKDESKTEESLNRFEVKQETDTVELAQS